VTSSAGGEHLGFHHRRRGHPVTNNGIGAAYVFADSGGTWTQQGELLDTDGTGDGADKFGYSVVTSGSSVMVGAKGYSGSKGAVYVFHRRRWQLDPGAEAHRRRCRGLRHVRLVDEPCRARSSWSAPSRPQRHGGHLRLSPTPGAPGPAGRTVGIRWRDRELLSGTKVAISGKRHPWPEPRATTTSRAPSTFFHRFRGHLEAGGRS